MLSFFSVKCRRCFTFFKKKNFKERNEASPNFIFTDIYSHWFVFNTTTIIQPPTLLKKTSGTFAFLKMFWNFQKQIFYRTPANDSFLIVLFFCSILPILRQLPMLLQSLLFKFFQVALFSVFSIVAIGSSYLSLFGLKFLDQERIVTW